MSAEMSVECWPICKSSVGCNVGQDVGRVSAGMSVEYRPKLWSSVGRDVG